MYLKVVEKSEPLVSLEEAKGFFRVLDNNSDDIIEHLISTATDRAEDITNRTLQPTIYELYLDKSEAVKLKKPPIKEILEVKYLNSIGVWRDAEYNKAIDNDSVVVDIKTPTDIANKKNCIKIKYEAGYAELPTQIKQYILIEALTMFENRELMSVSASVDSSFKKHYEHLLSSYRIRPCG